MPPDYDLRVLDMNVTTLSDADLDWADVVITSSMIIRLSSRGNTKLFKISAASMH